MKNSRRIECIVSCIKNLSLGDIGTDHCHIPITACLTNSGLSAIACDLNNGPLKRAQENINRHRLLGRIELRKGYGLEPLTPNEVKTITICSMGGMLMLAILEKSPEVVQSTSQLILQPQRDIPKVRGYIQKIGFVIKEEFIIEEKGHCYVIINCLKGEQM